MKTAVNPPHRQLFGLKKVQTPFLLLLITLLWGCESVTTVQTLEKDQSERQRLSLNSDWQFKKYGPQETPDTLIYDVRPQVADAQDDKPADSKPTEAVEVIAEQQVLKPWIMPAGNAFISDPATRYERPAGEPGSDFPFVQYDYDDSAWETVDLPHDWAIKGPFLQGPDAAVGGGMGRLPSPGVAWYRRQLHIPASDEGKSIFLDIEGAMSYAMVWLNGHLVGGWPYGYSSFRLDLTPYLSYGGENQLAIRLDNPPNSSRWYPGGGLYRDVWLVKTNPVHVDQWGTRITTPQVSETSATINLALTLANDTDAEATVEALTRVYEVDEKGRPGPEAATFDKPNIRIKAGARNRTEYSLKLSDPRLWGPPPTQKPHLYTAVTEVRQEGRLIDTYETTFGIRSITFDGEKGLMVNGEPVYLKGVNMHHDLGALGAAFNGRAAQRQLDMLKELGVNAIRMAHNPPAPALLDMTDRMGFLVVDEMFDSWERKKTPLDFHLIFPDWHEQDLRALVRRDRNHPSVIMWSTGNEVGEQYTGEEGAALAMRLRNMVNEEDPTRPTTASMNYAKPDMPMPEAMEVINLNYQGEGIRNAPAYAHLKGINTSPLYPAFHEKYPDKVIISSENAAALSSRGTYLFPVAEGISSPVSDGVGGDPQSAHVSAYELYTADFGSSADKVFRSIDQHPYVAGGFVWSGWDYLGEPTPYYSSRSSYFGIIDLAGFKKDRFYLYQSRWRPDLPIAHILPHWNWPDRVGEVTPVHVFTSGDEAELFLNGKSLGRKKKGAYEYRLRWDHVTYEPGELNVVVYKDGKEWAEDVVKTTGAPHMLIASADRNEIVNDGKDLAFITVKVADKKGLTVPDANDPVSVTVEGPGELVATDNGDPTNMTPFPSATREAFNGYILAIVRYNQGAKGTLTVTASAPGLQEATITVNPTNTNP
ncbi:beta-galactosidase GalB [Roseivirga sp. BDSF3-8]|uniref:beta-galactosidase GalB n=1 Tax=Roseivirga sp. BDSF3-8 TaxID=3241598 RepID=UPI003531BD6D